MAGPLFGAITYEKLPGGSPGSGLEPGDKITWRFSSITPSNSSYVLYGLYLNASTSALASPYYQTLFAIGNGNVINNNYTTGSNFVSSGANQSVLNAGNSASGTWTQSQTYFSDQGPYAVNYPLVPGRNRFNFTAVENFNLTNFTTVTIDVYTYTYVTPRIDSISAVRCDSDGTANPEGLYLKMQASWSEGTVGSVTYPATLTYQWGELGGALSAPIPVTAQNIFMPVVGGALDQRKTYNVVVTLTDARSTVTGNFVLHPFYPVIRNKIYNNQRQPYYSLGFGNSHFLWDSAERLSKIYTWIQDASPANRFWWYDDDPPYLNQASIFPILAFELIEDNANFIHYQYGGSLTDLFTLSNSVNYVYPPYVPTYVQQVIDGMLERWPTNYVEIARVPYRTSERVLLKQNYNAQDDEKTTELTYDKYTLISDDNADEILNLLFDMAVNKTETVSAEVILMGEKAGDMVSIDTDYGVKTGIIVSMDTDVNNSRIARIEVRC